MGALAVVWEPVRTLSRVAQERRVLLGFGVTAMYAALSLVSVALSMYGGDFTERLGPRTLPPDFPPELLRGLEVGLSVGLPIFTVLSAFAWWVGISLIMQLITRFFGGTGPLSGMFAAVGVASVPFVISAAIQLPITGLQVALGPGNAAAPALGLLGALINLGALLWHAALVVIGAALARRIGYGESAGSCAISCAGCFGLIIVLAVAIVAVAAIVAGASGSAGAS